MAEIKQKRAKECKQHIWVDARKETIANGWKSYRDIRVCSMCPAIRGDKKQ